jgi:4'-phosphopantetheinyl transferase
MTVSAPRIGINDVPATVWAIRLRSDGPFGWDRALAQLGAIDRRRAERFRFDGDRRRLAVSRLVLVEMLRHLVDPGCNAEAVVHEFGKPPRLRDSKLLLSMAHSGDFVACGVSSRSIGVDVEATPSDQSSAPVLTRELAASCLNPSEQSALCSLPDAERWWAFLRLWVRKEALLKATGTGMSADLTRVDVHLKMTYEHPDSSRWWLWEIPLGSGGVGAIASPEGVPVVVRGPSDVEVAGG